MFFKNPEELPNNPTTLQTLDQMRAMLRAIGISSSRREVWATLLLLVKEGKRLPGN